VFPDQSELNSVRSGHRFLCVPWIMNHLKELVVRLHVGKELANAV